MANSRLEKIGTIYTRAKGLIDSGARNWVDRPLWFDVYEAFPPKEEPRFDKKVPKCELKKIFYQEDEIRSLFHQNNKQIGTVTLNNLKYKTITQQFIDKFKEIENQYGEGVDKKKIYVEAVEALKVSKEIKDKDEYLRLSTAFKEVSEKRDVKVDFKDLFQK
ncbi:small ribosomal subunit protein mS23 [Onthophagus taurus]|uniref:small ribosomal subunit protein mS23 n=1 Tax=Onthophagus taurus TaxID=166361 RepID=UPI0039BE76EB